MTISPYRQGRSISPSFSSFACTVSPAQYSFIFLAQASASCSRFEYSRSSSSSSSERLSGKSDSSSPPFSSPPCTSNNSVTLSISPSSPPLTRYCAPVYSAAASSYSIWPNPLPISLKNSSFTLLSTSPRLRKFRCRSMRWYFPPSTE